MNSFVEDIHGNQIEIETENHIVRMFLTPTLGNGTTRMVEFTKSSVWELINELTVAANS